MKAIVVALFLLCLVVCKAVGQTKENYRSHMATLIEQVDTTESIPGFKAVSNDLMRVAIAEKNKWLPYYYASLCQVMIAFDEPDLSKIDAICDDAEKILKETEQLSPDASEIYCLKAMILFARIRVDYMNRGMENSWQAKNYLSKALEKNENNPRAHFLLGQFYFNVPTGMGGGKKKARPYFEQAEQLFAADQAKQKAIDVRWGRKTNLRDLEACRKEENKNASATN